MSYATVAQARAQLEPYFAEFDDSEVEVFLDAGASELDVYLSALFELPLTAWPSVIETLNVHVAAYRASNGGGFNVDGNPSLVRQLYDDALRTIRFIVDNKVRSGFTDSSSSVTEGGPGLALSDDLRGWDDE